MMEMATEMAMGESRIPYRDRNKIADVLELGVV